MMQRHFFPPILFFERNDSIQSELNKKKERNELEAK